MGERTPGFGECPARNAKLCLAMVLGILTLFALPVVVASGPIQVDARHGYARAAPEWLSPDITARLDIGFDVLVPTTIPAPFDGEPSVMSNAGWYSLYWLLPGTPPTFLQITGTVGGDIPDGSPYDLNNELAVNAEVQGLPAVHDVTPIYDTVWWQAGDVVYMVSSLNLSDVDSLSLANALAVLNFAVPPDIEEPPPLGEEPTLSPALEVPETSLAGEVITVGVAGIVSATLTADDGLFTDTGSANYPGIGAYAVTWRAPSTTIDSWVSFYLTDPSSGEWLASTATLVTGSAAQGPTASLDCPGFANAGDLRYLSANGGGTIAVIASDGAWPAQLPNTLFDPQSNGGRELTGALLPDRTATFLWRAPSNPASSSVRFRVEEPDGTLLAECSTEVDAAVAVPTNAPVPPAQPTQASESPPSRNVPSSGGDGTGGPAPPEVNAAPPRSTSMPTSIPTPTPTGRTVAQVEPRPSPTASPSPVPSTATPAPPTAIPATLRPGMQANDGTSGANPELLPTPTAGPTRTPAAPPPTPTAMMAAATGADGLVAMVIGPEGGELINPTGATLTIPTGALEEPATVRIKPVRDARLPVDITVDLIPGSGFDVSVATLGGDAITRLAADATLRLSLASGQAWEGVELYRIENGRLVRLEGTVRSENGISAEMDHFSRFVAGIPVPDEESDRDYIAWLIAGGGALMTLGAAFWIIRSLTRWRALRHESRRPRALRNARRGA